MSYTHHPVDDRVIIVEEVKSVSYEYVFFSSATYMHLIGDKVKSVPRFFFHSATYIGGSNLFICA
jgi:hypothetical protein